MRRTFFYLHILLLPIFAITSLVSNAQPSQPTSLEERAKTDRRLLPRYGLLPKTESEILADQEFVTETMKMPQFNGDRRAASSHMIELGFNYLYRQDPQTAMYRFNQAYLLDSTNADIYWAFGGFYMTLGNFKEGKKQYEHGLAKAPGNTHLLTDYGTYFMTQYYGLNGAGHKRDALTKLDSAMIHLSKSFKLDSTDQNTLYKLSICHWLKGDCENAWFYFDKCEEQGGRPITPEYTADLRKKCTKRK